MNGEGEQLHVLVMDTLDRHKLVIRGFGDVHLVESQNRVSNSIIPHFIAITLYNTVVHNTKIHNTEFHHTALITDSGTFHHLIILTSS